MLLMIAFMVTLSLHAAQRTMEEMKSIAYAAFNLSETLADPFAVPLLNIRYKSSDLLDTKLFENNEEAFCVFAFTNNAPGYVIVSADTRLPEIIAYSASDAFRGDGLPEAMKAYLQTFVEKMKATPESYVAKRRTRGKFFAKSSVPFVEPLLGDIAYDQGNPYNNACPIIGGNKTLTGCVATAMSQIMKYYEYPNKMKGAPISYITTTNKIPISWNCTSTIFNWGVVKDTYKAYMPPYTAHETVVKTKVMSTSGIVFDGSDYMAIQEFANETARTLSFKVQFILADSEGNFIRPIPQESHVTSLGSGYYYPFYWLYSPILPSTISDGTYRLYIGIQEDETTEWSLVRKVASNSSSAEEFYLTARKTGSYFTISGSDYQYPCGYSDDEAAEVAKLHAACGAAVEMDYGTGSSFAYYSYAGSALINNFSYDPSLEVVYSSFFSESGLHEHIQNELTSRRPVFMAGTSQEDYGHAFIIDGFRYDGSTPYYHVNWGWGGICNAYFLLDNIEGQGINYSYKYTLYCGIRPDNGIDEGKSFGCSSYKVDNSVYSAGKGMLVTIPADSELLNLSFQSFTGDIKAYACNGSISYALGNVYSASNMEPGFFLYGHNAYFNIPASIPTGTYCIVLKSQQAGSNVVREIYSPENPVVTIKGGKLLGDVNGDNKVDDKDVKILADYILEKKTSPNALKNPDVVGEGPITVSTVTAIINLIKGN